VEWLTRLRAALTGRYTIERELGRGGMALVFLARDLRHQRPVAIKVLRPELGAMLGAERFLREIQIAGRLSHPHILPMLESGEADGLLFYAMPYVDGESLRARMDREQQLPLEDALQIAREVADALSYAHSVGIVHRDIKPENILLEAGHAVVSDFGIARAIRTAGDEKLTATGIAMGTPAYMSPEQASGSEHIDGRSDVYSLACVVYEMLGGEPPHTGPTPQAILARQLTGEARSLRPIRSSVTPALDAVIRRALAPAPADRFPTPDAFAGALAHPGAVRLPRLGARRVRRLAAQAAIALLLGTGIWLLARRFTGHTATADSRLGLAVFPFRANGVQAGQWSEALADFLATALDGTPQVRVADPWALWRTLRPTRTSVAESPDPTEAERLALRAGTPGFVLGSVTQLGDRLELTIRIYRAGVREPAFTFAVTARVDSLVDLVQRAAVGIITRVWERGRSPNVPNIESYATRSADALKAYLAAKEAMRRGMVDSANAAIDHALALDSNFALALVAATGIKSWRQFMQGQPYTGLLELAQRAVKSSDSLSDRNRLRAQATLASVRTEGGKVDEALEQILRRDSTDLEAWDLLAYSHMVYGWQYGRGGADALAATEHVMRLDSTYVPALVRAAYLAAVAEDPANLRRQMARLARVDTTTALVRGTFLSLRTLLASDAGFPALADSVATMAVPEWFSVLRQLRINRPDRADLLLAKVRKVAGPGLPSRAAVGAQTQLAIAEGRLGETDSAIAAGAYHDFPNFDHQVELFLTASILAGVGDPALARRSVASLARFIPPESALVHFNDRPVWSTGWAIGAYHATFGDTAVARRWQAVFDRLPAGGTSKDYRGSLRADLEARIAARRGDLRGALHLTERAYDLWTIHANNSFEAWPEPAMRLQMALLLRAAGREDSAATLLRSLVPPTTWMGFLTARASAELGDLAERRGNRADAEHHYSQALALWKHGGPEVAALRERVESGLRRVTGEPRN
jgi:tetratricopeptide (TPR) repeat protein